MLDRSSTRLFSCSYILGVGRRYPNTTGSDLYDIFVHPIRLDWIFDVNFKDSIKPIPSNIHLLCMKIAIYVICNNISFFMLNKFPLVILFLFGLSFIYRPLISSSQHLKPLNLISIFFSLTIH